MSLDSEIEISSTAIDPNDNSSPAPFANGKITNHLLEDSSNFTDSSFEEELIEREASIADSLLTNSSCSCSISIPNTTRNNGTIDQKTTFNQQSRKIIENSGTLLPSPPIDELPPRKPLSSSIEKDSKNPISIPTTINHKADNTFSTFPSSLHSPASSSSYSFVPANNNGGINGNVTNTAAAISNNNINTTTGVNNNSPSGIKKGFYGRFWRNVQRSIQRVLKCVRINAPLSSFSSANTNSTFPSHAHVKSHSHPDAGHDHVHAHDHNHSSDLNVSTDPITNTNAIAQDHHLDNNNNNGLLDGSNDVPFSSIVASIPNQNVNVSTDHSSIALEINKKLAALDIPKYDGPHLLPPPLVPLSHKKCLVLDLDETLVHSSFQLPLSRDADFILDLKLPNMSSSSSTITTGDNTTSSSSHHHYNHCYQTNSLGHSSNTISSFNHDNGHGCNGHSHGHGSSMSTTSMTIYVCKRPGVDEFLRCMSKYFEIVIFTASLASYADPVINFIDPDNEYITHRLYRNSCMYFQGVYVKDLSRLGRDLKHTLIVDNSPASYMLNPDNAINIKSWFSDDQDKELENRIMPILIRWARDEEMITTI